jgi:hypothetical protein
MSQFHKTVVLLRVKNLYQQENKLYSLMYFTADTVPDYCYWNLQLCKCCLYYMLHYVGICVFRFVTLLHSTITASNISVYCCSVYSRGYLMKFN